MADLAAPPATERWCPFTPRQPDDPDHLGGFIPCLAAQCMAWNPATADCRRLETAAPVRAPFASPAHDSFGDWADERLVLDPQSIVLAGGLYDDYRAWTARQGRSPALTQSSFGRALAAAEIVVCGKDLTGRTLRRGARLKPAAPVAGEGGAA